MVEHFRHCALKLRTILKTCVSMSGGTNCATYEYGPFGEVIRATGPMAKANPFRFSTKYQDEETDLLYYGYRYYNASTGRWLSRDPAGEGHGGGLYVLVKNEPSEIIDILGLDYHESIVVWSVLDIWNKYGFGKWAYTGDANSAGMGYALPVPRGSHLILMQGCCASVSHARNLDVNVLTVLPNPTEVVDYGGPNPNNYDYPYNPQGYAAMQGHEARRRAAYRAAYNAYIAPVQGSGGLSRKCGVYCRVGAKEALLDYLDRLQTTAILTYTRWVSDQQDYIGEENWVKVNGRRDHLDQIYTIPSPYPMADVACPPH